jgi:hypothetical protein
LENYNQYLDCNGFVGLVSLAAVQGNLWNIKGGNKQIPEGLLKSCNARVILNACVTSVTEFGERNILAHELNGIKQTTQIYDYVIVAFPLTKNLKPDFFQKFQYKDHLNCELNLTETYFVEGNVHLFPDIPLNKRVQLHNCDRK